MQWNDDDESTMSQDNDVLPDITIDLNLTPTLTAPQDESAEKFIPDLIPGADVDMNEEWEDLTLDMNVAVKKEEDPEIKPTTKTSSKRYCEIRETYIAQHYWDRHILTTKHCRGQKLTRHKCDRCGRTYATAESLRFHIYRSHGSAVKRVWSFRCNTCERKIRNAHEIDSHLTSERHIRIIIRKYPQYLIPGTEKIDPVKENQMITKYKAMHKERRCA